MICESDSIQPVSNGPGKPPINHAENAAIQPEPGPEDNLQASMAAALLIDMENAGTHRLDLIALVDFFSIEYRMVIRRAYGNHEQLKGFQQSLRRANVEQLIHPTDSNGKNRADIQLVVDAMEIACTKPHIGNFVVVSGDSDFLPLVAKLQELNRQVCIVSRADAISRSLRSLCDQFYDAKRFSKFLTSPSPPAASPSKPKIVPPKIDQSRIDQPLANANHSAELLRPSALVYWAYRWFVHQHQLGWPLDPNLHPPDMSCTHLGKAIRKVNPKFQLSHYGFSKSGGLSKMLQTLESTGLVTLRYGKDRSELLFNPTKVLIKKYQDSPEPPGFQATLQPPPIRIIGPTVPQPTVHQPKTNGKLQATEPTRAPTSVDPVHPDSDESPADAKQRYPLFANEIQDP